MPSATCRSSWRGSQSTRLSHSNTLTTAGQTFAALSLTALTALPFGLRARFRVHMWLLLAHFVLLLWYQPRVLQGGYLGPLSPRLVMTCPCGRVATVHTHAAYHPRHFPFCSSIRGCAAHVLMLPPLCSMQATCGEPSWPPASCWPSEQASSCSSPQESSSRLDSNSVQHWGASSAQAFGAAARAPNAHAYPALGTQHFISKRARTPQLSPHFKP